MDLKEADILGDSIERHWYYRSKADILNRLLDSIEPSVVLDVGSGSGFFAKNALLRDKVTEAWCIDISYKKDVNELELGKSIKYRKTLREDVSPDVVLFMDVLEHVEDDIGLLKEYVDKAPYGTFFIISVPAFMFLWSDHDVFLGHKRRYDLPKIEHVVKESGLSIQFGFYYYSIVFPLAAVVRIFSKVFKSKQKEKESGLSRHNFVTNTLLHALCKIETSFFRKNRMFGLTAFCVARKE